MEIGKKEKQFFAATVCSVCGLCKDPSPDFCIVLHSSDTNQFIREIVRKINTLKDISPNSLDILFSFEGFCRLFCKEGKCPLYDKQCDSKLSTRISCYKSFIKQSGADIELIELAAIYQKWAGIEFRRIGEDLDTIIDIDNRSLTKSKRKKLRKAMKKAIKKMLNSKNIKTKNRCGVSTIIHKAQKKATRTSFFYNSNNKWQEKITQYLIKNEQHEDDNRQQSKAAKHTGQSN